MPFLTQHQIDTERSRSLLGGASFGGTGGAPFGGTGGAPFGGTGGAPFGSEAKRFGTWLDPEALGPKRGGSGTGSAAGRTYTPTCPGGGGGNGGAGNAAEARTRTRGCKDSYRVPLKGSMRRPLKGSIGFKALRTHILRLLGPKTILHKAFGLFGCPG